jgi:hypothetical protein
MNQRQEQMVAEGIEAEDAPQEDKEQRVGERPIVMVHDALPPQICHGWGGIRTTDAPCAERHSSVLGKRSAILIA